MRSMPFPSSAFFRAFFAVLIALLVGAFFAPADAAAALSAYVTCNTVPWGVSTNENAMDMAIGAGNWDNLRFETVNAGTLFSPSHKFIFMDGGDDCADIMKGFLGTNGSAISSWVNSGGSLFLNAAPNVGAGMSFGFGVTLTYPDFGGNGNAVDPASSIFHGPFTPVTTSYTGGWFAHATVSGGGITSLINNENNRSVLASLRVGNGFVLFGGMTTDNFHGPQPQAHNLLANILAFGGLQGGAAIPTMSEWSMLSFMLFAAAAGVWFLRRRPA